MDASQLGKIEKGNLGLSPGAALTIAKRFNVDINWLFEGEGLDGARNSPDETMRQSTLGQTEKILTSKNIDLSFVPIRIQSEYIKKFMDPFFINNLPNILIPGLPYIGESFRIFEVEGNSMEPTFREHNNVITERVYQDQWENIIDFFAYVIVTSDAIRIRRVYKRNEKDWLLSSDNERYPQFLQPISQVKELWFIKRRMYSEEVPPKHFEDSISSSMYETAVIS